MKYLTVIQVIVHYVLVGLGKLAGYIVTPLVYPHRDWLRNYIWNLMQVNGIKCNRSTIWSEDEFKYYTKNGYISKRITVMFNGVSLNGVSNLLIQIGNGSIVTTGYNSSSCYSGWATTATNGIVIYDGAASNILNGILNICLVNTNNYVSNHSFGVGPAFIVGGGSSVISATLDRLRITTINGTDTFNAG